ncbi:MAG: molybdenum hydroxylase, partial [Acidobacteria bacterium]|nr:molybdenum hydroxylase [Acidobacteriota bacterium]
MEIEKILVLIRGAGDIASGAARRLFLAGFRVAMTELPEPGCIRRAVSFAEALFETTARVEEVEGRRAGLEEVSRWRFDEAIPVIVDPEGASIAALHPDVLIDARMLKRNDGTRIDQAPLVGALGPGYTA